MSSNSDVNNNWVGQADVKAYDRFVSSMHKTVEMGINLATHRQALDMVANRALALAAAAVALRRGNVRGFFEALSYTGPDRGPKRHRKAKTFGNLWLEYHFGWSPLVSDMYNAGDGLQQPLPYHTFVKASAKDSTSRYIINQRINTPDVYSNWYTTRNVTYRRAYGAEVTVTNPNLFMLNALGLANPAVIAWDLVPFSFLVDWLTGFGGYIRSYSDFLGLHLTNPWTTQHWRAIESDSYIGVNYYTNSETGVRYSVSKTQSWTRSHIRLRRGTSTPVRKLSISLPDRVSPTRAATAISLLLQRLN